MPRSGNELDRAAPVLPQGDVFVLASNRAPTGISNIPAILIKAAGADPVRAFFVFLYLLQRDAEPVGEAAYRDIPASIR